MALPLPERAERWYVLEHLLVEPDQHPTAHASKLCPILNGRSKNTATVAILSSHCKRWGLHECDRCIRWGERSR